MLSTVGNELSNETNNTCCYIYSSELDKFFEFKMLIKTINLKFK